MATSGTHTFTLDLSDTFEEAFERFGEQLRTGYDYRTARRSLNLLMLEWQNRGLNLWTVKNDQQTLTAGVGDYALPAERLDVVEVTLRTNDGQATTQSDINMRRISVSNWARINNKLLTGRPNQYHVHRAPTGIITLKLWPVPDSYTPYRLDYWYIERIEDAGNSASNTMNIPPQYQPALIAGLAYYIALKKPDLANLVPGLKAVYDEQWDLAADESREKASFFVKPGGYRRL